MQYLYIYKWEAELGAILYPPVFLPASRTALGINNPSYSCELILTYSRDIFDFETRFGERYKCTF